MGDAENEVELNVATARDKESRSYIREQMLKRGLTEKEADEVQATLDGV